MKAFVEAETSATASRIRFHRNDFVNFIIPSGQPSGLIGIMEKGGSDTRPVILLGSINPPL